MILYFFFVFFLGGVFLLLWLHNIHLHYAYTIFCFSVNHLYVLFYLWLISFSYILTPSHVSVQFSGSVMFDVTPRTAACQAPCPSPTPGVYSNSCRLSWWCHPTSSYSVLPFSSGLSFSPASGSFQMNQFASYGQSIGVSASASVLPMNIQDWFPLGCTGWISLLSKGL